MQLPDARLCVVPRSAGRAALALGLALCLEVGVRGAILGLLQVVEFL